MPDVFDSLANTYDAQFTHTVIGRAQRAVVRKHITSILPDRPIRILELNCGTGEDALWLAGLGHHVTATDRSERMLETTGMKAKSAGVAVDVCRWDLTTPYPFTNEKFDLILSNFGGLNCLSPEDLHNLNKQLFELLAPGGQCILVVMGKFCLLESLHLFLTGKWTSVFRRSKKTAVPVRMQSGEYVATWYYSPMELFSTFSDGYDLINILPVGATIPPGYWKGSSRISRFIIRVLISIDPVFRSAFFARMSDHYLLHIQKMATG